LTHLSNKEVEKYAQLLGDLFEHCRPYFKTTYPLSNTPLFAAAEYLTFLIYPSCGVDEKNKIKAEVKADKDRVKFFNSAIWLSIKANPSIPKEEAKKRIKEIFGDNHNKITFKSAEENLSKAQKRLSKRIQAAHAYEMSTDQKDQSLAKIFEAYNFKVSNKKRNNYQDIDICNDEQTEKARKSIIKPSRGVIHLAHGLMYACFFKCPIYNRNIKTALLNPSWVNEALKLSERHLKSRILNDYHREKGVQTGATYKLDLNEIIYLI